MQGCVYYQIVSSGGGIVVLIYNIYPIILNGTWFSQYFCNKSSTSSYEFVLLK